jgi:ATP-dependent Clp protease protease subunit
MTGPWRPREVGRPAADPKGADWSDGLLASLFERRVVLVSRRLDAETANRAAAELMTLDALGDDPIELQIDCAEGELEAALSLMDVIDLVGVPIHATARGLVGGPAVGVLAVSTHRLATPHASFRLFEPETRFAGSAQDLARWADHSLERSALFCRRLAGAVHQAEEHVEADLAAGRFLSAEEALAYGLVDEISRARRGEPPTRPIGFAPR